MVKHLAFTLAISLLVLVFGGWSLWEPLGRDQGIHATIAAALLAGETTYSDVYNIKPPATTAYHAVSQLVFGQHAAAIRALDIALMILTTVLLFRVLVRLKLSERAAFLAVAGWTATYYSLSFWSRAQTDGWASFLIVLVVWLLLRGWRLERLTPFALAGGALALAFLLKYTVAGLGMLIFLPVVVRDMVFRAKDFAAFVLGGLAVLGIVFGLIAANGALEAFIEIQTFTLSYATGLRLSLADMLVAPLSVGLLNPFVAFLVILGAILLLSQLPRRELASWTMLVWICFGGLSYFFQGKGFFYHAWPMMLPLAACMAPACDAIFARLPKTSSTVFLALALVLFALPSGIIKNWGYVAAGQTDQLAKGWTGGDFDAEANRTAAEFLRTSLEEDETFFLWGYETELYFLSDRIPQHRFPYSWPFRVVTGGSGYQDELMAYLEADPPGVIVVEHGDAVPHVTGNPNDSREELANFPELAEFIATGYAKFGETPRFEYYRRRP